MASKLISGKWPLTVRSNQQLLNYTMFETQTRCEGHEVVYISVTECIVCVQGHDL